jgi:signal peptidase I
MKKSKNIVLILLCIVSILTIVLIFTLFSDQLTAVQALDRNASDIPVSNQVSYILCLAIFIASSIGAAIVFVHKHLFIKSPNENIIIYVIKVLILVIFLPIPIILMGFRPLRPILSIRKVILLLITLFVIIPIWFGYYYSVYIIITNNYYMEVSVSGQSNSMYPTFGKEFVDYTQVSDTPGMRIYYQGKPIYHKDIVIFESINGTSTMIKRVIATHNDTLRINDGLVYLNDVLLDEPYIFRARSTFGSTFLKECDKIIVPYNMLFVMGDNRTASGDSREFGFVPIKNVQYILSLNEQIGTLDKHWRDTKNDASETSKVKINKIEFLSAINKKRTELGIQAMRYDPRLETSSNLMGSIISDTDTTQKMIDQTYTSMKEAGYPYPKNYAFSIINGRFSTNELTRDELDSTSTLSNYFDKRFSDFGLSEVEKKVGNCSRQVIVQHFGTYFNISYWKKILENMTDILPSWQNTRQNYTYYNDHKDDTDMIISLITTRINNVRGIIETLESNIQLSKEQSDYTYEDAELSNRLNTLINKLNV